MKSNIKIVWGVMLLVGTLVVQRLLHRLGGPVARLIGRATWTI